MEHPLSRALADQADRTAVILESVLAALRSPRLDDRAARAAAIDVAATALVDLRTEGDRAEADALEAVVGAFARLKSDLRPLVRFGELDVQFVEPPAAGRALPGAIAHAARAIVRGAVLAHASAGDARRVRVQWDCDGLHLLIGIRDDGAGDRAASDDDLRPIVEHLAALGGRLDVESTPGWGTNLDMRIPLDPPAVAGPSIDAIAETERERQILEQLATGARNVDIAAAIGLSAHTVKYHVSKLLRRTGARSRAALIASLR